MSEWVTYALRKGPIRGQFKNDIGLTLNIRAKPEIEEFMKSLSQGQTVGVDSFGPLWINQESPEVPLDVYVIDTPLNGPGYVAGSVGKELLIAEPRKGVDDGEKVNLSILRLVGISKEGGVTVGISGIYSTDYCMRLRNALGNATKRFLSEHMVPLAYTVQILCKD